MGCAFRARIAAALAPISHRHDWLQRCIDRASDGCFAWTRNYHRPTWLRYSGQRIRLGAPRLAARHHSGFAHPRQTRSAGSGRNAMTCRRIVWPCSGTQTFQSVRPAEFYSADVMVPREQRVGNPLGAQAGMPMFHLSANRNETYADGVFED